MKSSNYASLIPLAAFIGIVIPIIFFSYPIGSGKVSRTLEPAERDVQSDAAPETDASQISDTSTQIITFVEKKTSAHLIFQVSAYNSVPGQTDSTPCLSASGENICELHEDGLGICASNDYPFGTALFVEGLGNCVVLDRMNSRYTGKSRIDWFIGNDVASARRFGIQFKKVTVY